MLTSQIFIIYLSPRFTHRTAITKRITLNLSNLYTSLKRKSHEGGDQRQLHSKTQNKETVHSPRSKWQLIKHALQETKQEKAMGLKKMIEN